MGGSKSGGSSTTINQPLTKKQYDPTGYKYREQLLPKLYGKYDIGLTPREIAQYRGQGIADIERTYGSGLRSLRENLIRGGIAPSDGAFAESVGDLLRDRTGARANLNAAIMGQDIATKQMNLQNLLNLIADAGAIGTAATTQTYTMPGQSPIKGALGGALGGGIGGAALGSIPALSPYTIPLAVGGAVLGGLGGLL